MESNTNTISETLKSFELTFTESGNSGLPIAKHQNGKICLLDKKHNISRTVKAGETWECTIVSEHDRKIVVSPVVMLVSVNKNNEIMQDKINQLKSRFNG